MQYYLQYLKQRQEKVKEEEKSQREVGYSDDGVPISKNQSNLSYTTHKGLSHRNNNVMASAIVEATDENSLISRDQSISRAGVPSNDD